VAGPRDTTTYRHIHIHTYTQAYLENAIDIHPSLLLELLDEVRDGKE
jgi:hypothetical protein